ncbi:hypothetical protein E1211_02630 [Micromonospora sp. 15K316]|nr:hypothetical protein E1211_02630 [Micromonospora sp. 15K316]
MPADRDRLDPTWTMIAGPSGGPCLLAPHRVFVSTPILLCVGGRTATRHPRKAAENSVAGRTAASTTPPTRQPKIDGRCRSRVHPGSGGSRGRGATGGAVRWRRSRTRLDLSASEPDDRLDRPHTCC